jgi:hypothetical protein
MKKRIKGTFKTMFVIPAWVFFCLAIVFGSIIISIIIFLIVKQFTQINVLKRHHDLAGYIIGVFGVLYSVLLGYTLVALEEHHGQIIALIDEEAYIINDLFNSTMTFPEKSRIEIQEKIKTYVESVMQEEWPTMYIKLENKTTHNKLQDIWQAFYNFQPKSEQDKIWFSKCIDLLNEVNTARLHRIHWEGIGFFPWLTLLIGALILTTFLFFFGTENLIAHLVLNSLFIGYFAFTLYIVYILNNPFLSPIKVMPKAFEYVYPNLKIK